MSIRGLILWAVDSSGNPVKVLADPDGTLRVDGTVSVSGTVDISDRWARQLGQIDIARYLGSAIGLTNPLHSQIVYGGAVIDTRSIRALLSNDVVTAYGSQTQALLQRATTYDLIVQLRSAGVEIDPRSIRALAKATDEVYSVLRTDAGVPYDARDRSWTITENLNRAWSLAKASDNVYAVLKTDAGVALDPRDRNWTLTSSDAIKAYGSQTQALLQRALTYDLLVQLSHQGSEYDARQIRALTSSDVVDIVDKAARLLGVVYGSQGQQLLQRATTYDLIVQLRTAGTEYDARQIRALTNADVITAQQATRTSLLMKPEREDGINLGGTASPNNAGVQIVAPSGTLKPKVFDCGYEVVTAGLHYFYFGTSTAATTRRFCSRQTVGMVRQSFVQPRVGNAGDGIYLFSAVSDANIPYDLNYVLEA